MGKRQLMCVLVCLISSCSSVVKVSERNPNSSNIEHPYRKVPGIPFFHHTTVYEQTTVLEKRWTTAILNIVLESKIEVDGKKVEIPQRQFRIRLNPEELNDYNTFKAQHIRPLIRRSEIAQVVTDFRALGTSFDVNKLEYNTIENKITERIVTDTSNCLLYTSPSPRDATLSRMPSSA